MKKIILGIIKLGVVVYLGLMLALVLGQKQLVFIPSGAGTNTPALFSTPYESIKLPSGDGTLDAWWVSKPDDPNRPNLLYCHGNGGNLSGLAHVSSIFYSYGWNAFLFDYRGYGASVQPPGSELSEDRVFEDAENAYQWLLTKSPESRIFLWGHSLGSSICSKIASKHNPAGLIIEGAFPSIYAMARYRYPWALMAPFLILDKFDTAQYLQNHRFPILQIHAERDTIIPFTLGKNLYDGLSGQKEFIAIPKISHTGFPKVAGDYREPIVKIVNTWIRNE